MNHPEAILDPEGAASLVEQPPDDQVLASLERILASPEFSGSDQLSRFLRHIVERRLSADAAPLKESLIGNAVFHRGPGYDPKVDPIVRVEARRLRARLDSYYAGLGNADPIRISLPKGGYSPRFDVVKLPVADAPAELPALVEPATQPFQDRRRRRKPRLLYCVAGMLLIAVLSTLAWEVRQTATPEHLASRFWSGILDSDRPVLVVPADSGLVMWEGLTHRTVHLPDYITGKYRLQSASGDLDPLLIQDLSQHRYTSIADFDFVAGLSHRPESIRRGIRTRYARDLRLDEIRPNNLILLGAKHSNPWVELFEPDAAFRLEHDEATLAYRIAVASPRPGEPAEIAVAPSELQKEIYAVISYHRNREGSGTVLMLGGTTVAGTEAAVDLLLDDSKLAPWLRKAEARGRFRGFDILLHARLLGSGPLRAEVASFRIGE